MKYYRGLVVLVALLLTGIAAYNKISVYRIAVRSSEALLKSNGAFLWISLAESLRELPLDKNLFAAATGKHPDAQVAYLALYDNEGTIVLHSDSRLIGTASNEPGIVAAVHRRQEPQAGFRKDADGTMVYVMDREIDILKMDRNPFLLRVALHPSPALVDVRQAKRHIILSMSLILFIYFLAWLFFYYSKKIAEVQRNSMEKEHLARLGEMAAVVAHEIRSPLSAIKGYSQYLSEKSSGNPAGDEGCRIITSEAIRLEHLTEDLLSYARTDKVNPVNFSLIELVEEVWILIVPHNGNIVCKKEISPADDIVYTDREKLRRILMNILQNSLDALGDQGVIDIKTQHSRGKLTLSIRDSGKGIDDNTVKDVFKPFFTTKAKGTGLGLAIVEKNIKSLNGTVTIASELGTGTEITIVLPRHEDG